MRHITIFAIVAALIGGIVGGAALFFASVTQIAGSAANSQHDRDVVMNNTLSTNNSNNGSNNGYSQVKVKVNGIELLAEIAATSEHRAKGLSVKENLSENEAMLFVFGRPGDYSFWMKDMKFPIDIIWLDEHKRVVHIEHALEPCGPISCPTYNPDENSLYVLETVAGFAKEHGIRESTQVEFQLDT